MLRLRALTVVCSSIFDMSMGNTCSSLALYGTNLCAKFQPSTWGCNRCWFPQSWPWSCGRGRGRGQNESSLQPILVTKISVVAWLASCDCHAPFDSDVRTDLGTKFGAKMLIDAEIMAKNLNSRWLPSAILEFLYHHIGPPTKSFRWATSACQILC